jgi:hypothetical protein
MIFHSNKTSQMGATRGDAPMVCRLEALGGRPWRLHVSSDGVAVEVLQLRRRTLAEARHG